jgi:hypothetical protein
MDLHLNDDEARTLFELLRHNLGQLRLEVARTDQKDMRHLLVVRQDLIEQLLNELQRAGV